MMQMRDGAGDDEAQVQRLAALARAAVEQRLRTSSDPGAVERLARALREQHTPPARPRWVWPVLSLGAAATVAVLLLLRTRDRPGPAPVAVALSYAVESLPAAEAAAPAQRLRFSDGTTIAADDHAAVAVESATPRAPRVRVKAHLARVRVIHRPGTQWTFAAGPFEVEVTGTAFNLGWDPAAQALSLDLLEGSVILRGPHLPGGALPVHAGQRVSVSLATGEVAVRDATDRVDERPASGAAPGPATAPGESPPPVPAAATVAHHVAAERWSDLVRKGAFARVIALAHRRSLDDCQRRCSPDELRALGDAARYSNHPALAARTFRSLRERFAGTPDATAAAFLLGRTYEARGQWRDAEHFYDAYLAEAPAGAFAIEAASGRARAQARQRGRGSDGAP